MTMGSRTLRCAKSFYGSPTEDRRSRPLFTKVSEGCRGDSHLWPEGFPKWNNPNFHPPNPHFHLPQDPRDNSTPCNDMETSRSHNGIPHALFAWWPRSQGHLLLHLPPETTRSIQDISVFRTCLRSTWLLYLVDFLVLKCFNSLFIFLCVYYMPIFFVVTMGLHLTS